MRMDGRSMIRRWGSRRRWLAADSRMGRAAEGLCLHARNRRRGGRVLQTLVHELQASFETREDGAVQKGWLWASQKRASGPEDLLTQVCLAFSSISRPSQGASHQDAWTTFPRVHSNYFSRLENFHSTSFFLQAPAHWAIATICAIYRSSSPPIVKHARPS